MNERMVFALRDGDTEAFRQIFLVYFGKVKYFIRGLLKSEEDAEELAQDVLVRLWLVRESLDPAKSLNAYIYRMARNAAFNFLKSKLIHETYVRENVREESGCTTEDELMARETALLIEMAVSRMPERRQIIYRMSRNEGISNEDIALQLNISRKTVENQLSLALHELRGVVTCLLVFFKE